MLCASSVGMNLLRWLKPMLVAQIEFTEYTPDDHLRHTRCCAHFAVHIRLKTPACRVKSIPGCPRGVETHSIDFPLGATPGRRSA
jgi:hypothetical protein